MPFSRQEKNKKTSRVSHPLNATEQEQTFNLTPARYVIQPHLILTCPDESYRLV